MSKHLTLPLVSKRDNLFLGNAYPKPFQFNSAVAEVFDDMVSRSVPLYQQVQEATLDWAGHYYTFGSKIYDIGCSTGTTLALMAENMPSSIHFVGVDTSAAMLKKAEQKLAPWQKTHKIDLIDADAGTLQISNASVVVLNYVLQFISVNARAKFLRQICEGLNPGGILILSEKLRFSAPDFQEVGTRLYERFKEENGYSRTEIERKKEALDQVLIALTYDEQIELLKAAGFAVAETIIRWHPFTTIVAKKSS